MHPASELEHSLLLTHGDRAGIMLDVGENDGSVFLSSERLRADSSLRVSR